MLQDRSLSDARLSADGCYVQNGAWLDPYTDRLFFTPETLEIDHLIPLKWAWDHGAQAWDTERLEAFANDPANLLVVDASANRQKSDSGPMDWMPPNEAFACDYLAKFALVVDRYGLELTLTEAIDLRKRQSVC